MNMSQFRLSIDVKDGELPPNIIFKAFHESKFWPANTYLPFRVDIPLDESAFNSLIATKIQITAFEDVDSSSVLGSGEVQLSLSELCTEFELVTEDEVQMDNFRLFLIIEKDMSFEEYVCGSRIAVIDSFKLFNFPAEDYKMEEDQIDSIPNPEAKTRAMIAITPSVGEWSIIQQALMIKDEEKTLNVDEDGSSTGFSLISPGSKTYRVFLSRDNVETIKGNDMWTWELKASVHQQPLKGKGSPEESSWNCSTIDFSDCKLKGKLNFQANDPSSSVSFHLETAFIAEPIPPPLSSKSINDLIPPVSLVCPKWTPKEDLQNEIDDVVRAIAGEYRNLFGSGHIKESSKDQRRRLLLQELNNSSIYATFKESLKKVLLKSVRGTINANETPQSLQEMVSKLYVFAIEQVNSRLNEQFVQAASANEPKSATALPSTEEEVDGCLDLLLELAEENVKAGEIDVAGKMFYERIRVMKHCVEKFHISFRANVWKDVANFEAKNGDSSKAVECAKEAVSTDPHDLDSLKLLTALFIERNELDDALVTAQSAIDLAPEDDMSVALLALLYDLFNRHDSAQTLLCDYRSTTSDAKDLIQLYCDVSKYLINLKMKWAENPLSLIAVGCQHSNSSYRFGLKILLGRMKFEVENDLSFAERCWTDAAEICQESGEPWRYLAAMYVNQIRYSEALNAYEMALGMQYADIDPWMLFELGQLHMKQQSYGKAKECFLWFAEKVKCSTAWLWIGKACLELDDLADADEALCQANKLNNQNPEVWLSLSLLCAHYSPPKATESRRALEMAKQLGTNNSGFVTRIERKLKDLGF